MDNINNIEEHFEKQLDRTNTWLSFAEAKNAALIAIDVAIIAIFFNMYSNNIFFIILMILFLISGMICLCSFFPRLPSYLKPLKKNNIPKNLLFWADTATISTVDSYIEQTIQRYYPTFIPELEIIKNNKNIDLVSEILINSRITRQKYMLFKIALCLNLLAFLIVIILLIIA